VDWITAYAGEHPERAYPIAHSWDEAGRLHLAHSAAGGSTCVIAVPNAAHAVLTRDPLTLREPVRCTKCGERGRVENGWWIHA
jgi:hypothetical protein